jgi:two-component system, NtrC family, sensor histidine kinase KinB
MCVGPVRLPSLRGMLKGYLLAGLVVISLMIGVATVHLTRELEAQAELTTQLIAEIAGPVLFSETPDVRAQRKLQQVIEAVDFPFIFTDVQGRPIIWNPRQVGVPLPESLRDVLEADLENPTDPGVRRLLELIEQFDRERDPVPLAAPGGMGTSGLLHYGSSRITGRLVWLPWLEAGLIIAFMGAVLLAFRNMKRSEQRNIWVGMAKETAHQMGTPLTSLEGWLALLQDEHALAAPQGTTTREQVLAAIADDVERLGKVSARFSQIGSRPKLAPGRVDEVVQRSCDYFRARLPHLGKQVRIETRIEELAEVPIAPQLLDWAVENLLKNGLDAIDKDVGKLEVSCRANGEGWIEIVVRDNGKGMSAALQRRVFDPGFSTKQRGWGMGLALVRRIVEEVHRGRIDIPWSVEGEGSAFRIRIPSSA